MANIQEKIFTDTLKNLGIEKNVLLISKAKEIHDIISIKSSGVVSSLNDNAKIIICLDISCELLNISFDMTAAIKLSTIKKTRYYSNRKILMRLMNLNKKMGIKEIILKLEISNENVEKKAEKIFDSYKEKSFQIDLDHPQFITMSVYQACKLEKVKVSKKTCINISNLKPNQWSQLEKSWDKWVSAAGSFDKENIKEKQFNVVDSTSSNNEIEMKVARKRESEPEDYEVWAKRTLDKARSELRSEIL